MAAEQLTLDRLVNEREKRILEFALRFLVANLDEQSEWIFSDDEPAVTQREVQALADDLGIPVY